MPAGSLHITATAGTVRGVAKGGKTATAVKPAGTRARTLPGLVLGWPPPPGDPGVGVPGGISPGGGLRAKIRTAVAKTVAAPPCHGVTTSGAGAGVVGEDHVDHEGAGLFTL